VYLQPEALLHLVHKLARPRGGSLRQHLLEEIDDVFGELVTFVGPRPVRDDPRKAFGFETLAGGVERWPREPEPSGGLRHRISVDSDSPQHLVLDLDEVLRVEEVVFGEERVADRLRPSIEGTVLFEGTALGGHVKKIMP
jgi:hypothetical protein